MQSMNYSSAGVLDALAFLPIGEGAADSESESKLHPSKSDVVVSTVNGLLEALDGPADTIAIANDVVRPH
jgi:hypothetical protein